MVDESFVIMLRPAPKYSEPGVDDIVSEHFKHLQGLLADGKLIMAGRFSDVLIGLVIIRADSLDSARKIMNSDPAIKAGVFHGEVYQWRIALQEDK